MNLLTDYTTYSDIRSCLGVNQDELPDATLALSVYQGSLDIELETISSGLAADFLTIKGKAENVRTATEQKVFKGVTVFTPYAVALQLASSLPLFAPKQVSDGKATLTRDSSAPYQKAIERCEKEYDRLKVYLTVAYAAFKGTSATSATLPPLFRGGSPSANPITG